MKDSGNNAKAHNEFPHPQSKIFKSSSTRDFTLHQQLTSLQCHTLLVKKFLEGILPQLRSFDL